MDTKRTPDVTPKAATAQVKGPKTETFEYSGTGKYNAIGLPVVPHAVTKVSDAGKGKLGWNLVCQQVVASRCFVPPVVVEYITVKEHALWHQAKLDAEAREAAK